MLQQFCNRNVFHLVRIACGKRNIIFTSNLKESDMHKISCLNEDCSVYKGMSKSLKREAKYEIRKERRKFKKEEKKQKLTRMLEDIPYEDKKAYSRQKRLEKQQRTENALRAYDSDINVCIELGFNDLNSQREQRSLVKQCIMSYAAIRNSMYGVSLHLSSFTGPIEKGLAEQGALRWHVKRHEKHACDVFDKKDLIFLSPDAVDKVSVIEPSKVYIIGGIVDRTVHNNITLDMANENGIKALRLPIKEYFPQSQSHVMNVDQVVSLFCYFQETQDWQKSFERSVPHRRQTHNEQRKHTE